MKCTVEQQFEFYVLIIPSNAQKQCGRPPISFHLRPIKNAGLFQSNILESGVNLPPSYEFFCLFKNCLKIDKRRYCFRTNEKSYLRLAKLFSCIAIHLQDIYLPKQITTCKKLTKIFPSVCLQVKVGRQVVSLRLLPITPSKYLVHPRTLGNVLNSLDAIP